MAVKETLASRKGEIMKRFGVKHIGLFGSCARGEETENSDVDVLVEFEEPSFDNFMDLAFYLEDLFGRKVDILTPEGVRSIRFKEVAETIQKGVVNV